MSLQERGISPGPPERLTIEQKGVVWGGRARERMFHQKEPVVAIVRKTEEYDCFRRLPRLGAGRSQTDVRFDPASGKLYYTTWREKRTTEEEGRRKLKPLQRGQLPEYEVLLPRGRRHTQGYLENLPQSSPVQELLFHHADTIEEAIAKVGDIVQAPIRLQAQEVIAHAANLATRFIERGLTEEGLRELANQTGRILENACLSKPNSPGFQKAMGRLKKACERDSRGRINNLVSRMRVQSAYVWAVRRLVVGSFVQRKHGENLHVLTYELETTRWAISSALRQLKVFLGHGAFGQPERPTGQPQREIMAKVMTNIVESLKIVRVAPYLAASRAAAINLVGCREEKREANKAILGISAEELFALTPVTRLLKGEGEIQEIFLRVNNSVDILEQVLKRDKNESV
ncbi:MAG: hypothetical protein Q8Q24_00065 [bacterium]|nr:hypothetical protein [bacterium]